MTHRLALRLALVLPALLGGEHGEDDGLAAADGRRADGLVVLVVARGVEQARDHRHTPVVDLLDGRILLGIHRIDGEGLQHQLLAVSEGTSSGEVSERSRGQETGSSRSVRDTHAQSSM